MKISMAEPWGTSWELQFGEATCYFALLSLAMASHIARDDIIQAAQKFLHRARQWLF